MTELPVRDQQVLVKPQAELLARIRNEIGPLVGASLAIKRGQGWFINLSILRRISDQERSAVDTIVAASQLPVIVQESVRPAHLLPARTRRGATP